MRMGLAQLLADDGAYYDGVELRIHLLHRHDNDVDHDARAVVEDRPGRSFDASSEAWVMSRT